MKSWTSFVPWWFWVTLGILGSLSAMKWLITSREEPLWKYRFVLVCSLIFMATLLVLDNIIQGTGYFIEYLSIVQKLSIPSVGLLLATIFISAYKKATHSSATVEESAQFYSIVAFCGIGLLICALGIVAIKYFSR